MTNPDKVGQYIAEARKMGIAIKPPDINKSEVEICAKDGEIYFGLADVKNAGKGAAREALRLRDIYGPFESYDQFLEIIEAENEEWEALETKSRRSPKQTCTARAINSWRDAGAFDSIGYQEGLQIRAAYQKELLGITLIDVYAPLIEQWQAQIKGKDALRAASEAQEGHLSTYAVVGEVELRKTRSDAHPRYANKEFAMVSLEWQEHSIRAVCFNTVWEHYREDLTEGSFCLLGLKLTAKGAQIERAERLV